MLLFWCILTTHMASFHTHPCPEGIPGNAVGDGQHSMPAGESCNGRVDPARDAFQNGPNTLKLLQEAGYITDLATAECVVTATWDDKPILLEGPPGAGKTEIAHAVSRVTGMPIVVLQCYEGLQSEDAFGRYIGVLQDSVSRTMDTANIDLKILRDRLHDRELFHPGALMRAMESESRVILLIDEVDKVPMSFEAVLLEFLSQWTLSIPGLGTLKAKTKPFCVLTSNNQRNLSYALLGRCQYILVEYPTAEMEASILDKKFPDLDTELREFIAHFAVALRRERFYKAPGIREIQDLARKMVRMGKKEIESQDAALFIPILFKNKEDVLKMRQANAFGALLRNAEKARNEARSTATIKAGIPNT
jgi:MoxR-like ATPase